MDWIKYPYRARCQFNNGGPMGSIQWTVADPDAPTLPFGSAICNLALEQEWTKWDECPIGEVWNGRGRSANWRVTPNGINGDHFCGTEEDFTQGGVYDPVSPPTLYGANGWPVCCYPPVKIYGGAGAGGHVRPTLTWVVPMTGGVSIGGVILSQFTASTSLAGGVAVGGAIPATWAATSGVAGGVEVGGSQAVSWSATSALAGGFQIGGFLQDTYDEYGLLGEIFTLNSSGGPVLLTSNITLEGEGSVTLSVSGQTIFFTGAEYDRESSLVTSPVLITGNATVTIGAVNVVTASSAITLTIPSGGVGQQFAVIVDEASTHTVTLSGSISGVSGKVLYKGESLEAVYAGSEWRLLNRSLQPMAASIVPTSGTTFPTTTEEQLTLGTPSFDNTGLGMADVTHNQILIQRTGLYQVSASILFNAGQITGNASGNFMRVIVNSNGDGITGAILEDNVSVLSGQALEMRKSATVELNAGDKITVWAQQNSGASAVNALATRAVFLMAAELVSW